MTRIGRILLLSSLFAARAAFADHVGTWTAGDTVHCDLTTATSIAAALSGGTITVYKDGGTTTSTSGVTLTASRNSIVGYNHVAFDTSADGTFYATAHYFDAVISAGTVGGASVVGFEVCSWRLGLSGASAADMWTYATRTLTDITGETTVVSPVGTGGLLTLVRKDSYYVADGTELSFTRDTWPDLTSATSVTLTVRSRSDDSVVFAVTDKVTSRVTGAGSQTVVFELASTDTDDLTPGRLTGKYDIRAVLSNGHIVTLEVTDPPNSYGGVTVLEDQTR